MEKETVIIDKTILDFLYKIYFNFSDGNKKAAINRAYRDFNRTLIGLPTEKERPYLKKKWSDLLEKEIESTQLVEKFNNWNDFNIWHKTLCTNLRNANPNYTGLTVGQAQKWVNMTLKYLYVMGEEKVKGISINYDYFHVPIDNIIQEEILKDLNRDHKNKFFDVVWSKISDYDKYLEFQSYVRKEYPNQIPMNVEFNLFNKGIVKENI